MTDDLLPEEWLEEAPEGEAERRAAEHRAAVFFSQRPEFFGYWMEIYREAEELSPLALARHLGCEVEALPRLAICFRPRPETLWDDTLQLAERFGVSQDALADVVLDAETHLAVREAAAKASASPSTRSVVAPGAIFAAANDRQEEEELPSKRHETSLGDEDGC